MKPTQSISQIIRDSGFYEQGKRMLAIVCEERCKVTYVTEGDIVLVTDDVDLTNIDEHMKMNPELIILCDFPKSEAVQEVRATLNSCGILSIFLES